MITDRSLANMLIRTKHEFYNATEVHTERWQGADISKRPDMVTHEVLNWHCDVPLFGEMSLDQYRLDIEPNLPWADNHFLERVGGEPLNPGVEWANWPWAASADKFREGGGKFNHTYMERLWPRWARQTSGGKLGTPEQSYGARRLPSAGQWEQTLIPHLGINGRFYGDLQDLVELLAFEPLTRQAWIPLFFPEDTGVGDGGRKPCTLGYQFIRRGDQVHIYYPLRSCDFIRHFRDDVYLAIRLLLWVIEQCKVINPEAWKDAEPGHYVMHCTSLHVFANDYREMFKVSGK